MWPGAELWKTDGTGVGTQLVKDLNPGAASSSIVGLTNINGSLYFSGNDLVSGVSLWKSDGTSAGTLLVKDLVPGPASATILPFFNHNGQLVFSADDGNGFRTWISNGTTVGTMPLVSTTGVPAFATSFTNLNGRLIAFGREVLQVNPNIQVDLTTSTTDRALVIRKTTLGIEVFDQTNATQLAFISNVAFADAQQLSILGSATANETVTLDFQSGGYFAFPGGITIDGGSSGSDSLSIVGSLSQQLNWQSGSTTQAASIGVQQSTAVSISNIDGFESITTSGFLSAATNGRLQAGPPQHLLQQSRHAESRSSNTNRRRYTQQHLADRARLR